MLIFPHLELLFNAFIFKNMAPPGFCKNFSLQGFVPIGWSARTGRDETRAPRRRRRGERVQSTQDEPRPPARVTKRCAPEETPKGGPLGGKAGPTSRPKGCRACHQWAGSSAWESVGFASRRPRVRIPAGPPRRGAHPEHGSGWKGLRPRTGVTMRAVHRRAGPENVPPGGN